MVNVFEEVDEQLRSQRFEALIRHGWPFAVAGVVALLIGALGFWGWTSHEANEQAKASAAYQKALDAAARGDIAAAGKGFAELATSAPPAYRALSLMQQSQISIQQNNITAAVGQLDQAGKIAPDAVMADDARLKAALLLIDTAPIADIEARLAPLTAPKAPFRVLAIEARAMAELQAGNLAAAKSGLQVLTLSQDVSQGAQTRARAALDLIKSGTAASVGAAAKAAAALPQNKIPALPQGMPTGVPGGPGESQ